MKNLYTIFLLSALSLISIDLNSQNFMELLKKGDYVTLAKHLDHEVNIEFKRDRQTLNREQAIASIKKRIDNFGPTKWEALHEGKADSHEDKYVITKVYNSKNEGLRIFMHIEIIDGEKKICSVRFRKLLR